MNPNRSHFPVSVLITLGLILLHAAFWFGYALLVVFNGISSISGSSPLKWVMVLLACAASAVLAGTAFFLGKRTRMAFYFSLALFVFLAVLSITDEFGLADLLYLVISLIPLVLLCKDRAWYLRKEPTFSNRE